MQQLMRLAPSIAGAALTLTATIAVAASPSNSLLAQSSSPAAVQNSAPIQNSGDPAGVSKDQLMTLQRIKASCKPRSKEFPLPAFRVMTDPYTIGVSENALQMIRILELDEKLRRLHELQQQVKTPAGQSKAPLELRQDLTDLKLDILQTIEQARLEIDFVVAEIDEEQAGTEELLQAYTSERDAHVNQVNLAAFRANGAMWALAEALDIPTYSKPKYSIPSGTIGILAGIIPSVFSAYAVRYAAGSHVRHEREPYQNMLAKIYGFPTIPATEYPPIVWNYLNTPPPGQTAKTRKDILIEHWIEDRNIHIFDRGISERELSLLVGLEQPKVDINLMADRLIMLREIKAFALQMSGSLMEINMVVLEKKHL